MSTDTGDELATVVSFVAGDEAALGTVYAQWSALIYSVALRSLGNVADAETVTQRVFTTAWTSRLDYDPEQDHLPAWLVRIARDVIVELDVARRRADPATDGVQPLADRLMLADELSQMPDDPQQVIKMAFSDELTLAQIAERTGLPPGQVKDHLNRGLHTLRERLAVLHDAQ